MRILGLSITVIALAVAALAATWFSKSIYSESVNQHLAEFEQLYSHSDLSLERDIIATGFFHFSDRIRVTLPLTDADTTVQVTLENACTVIPLYVSCDVEVKEAPILVAEMDRLIPGLSNLPYQLSTSVNVLTSTFHTELTTKQHTLSGEGYELSIAPLSVDSDTALDMSETNIQLVWQGATWQAGNLAGTVSDLQLSSVSDKVAQGFYLGNSRLSLTTFDIRKGRMRYTGSDLLAITRLEALNDSSYGITQQVDQATLVVSNDSKLSVDDILINVAVHGLGEKAMSYLSNNASASVDSATAANEMINAFGASTLTIPVKALSAELNGEKFYASGVITVAPFSASDVQQGTVRRGVNGKISITVDSGLINELPSLKPLFENFLAEGYMAKDAQGNLAANLTVNKGQLSSNGQAVRL